MEKVGTNFQNAVASNIFFQYSMIKNGWRCFSEVILSIFPYKGYHYTNRLVK